jgi:hypothetical protein
MITDQFTPQLNCQKTKFGAGPKVLYFVHLYLLMEVTEMPRIIQSGTIPQTEKEPFQLFSVPLILSQRQNKSLSTWIAAEAVESS